MTNRETPASDNRLVWYAVYGSNLLRRRFDCYIQGGKPKGATKESVGCRDKTPPRDARRFILAHSLYFAEHSESWGDAIAFIRRTASDAHTYMYLITYGQFNDVVRQENGRPIPHRVVVPSFDSLPDADHWEIEGYERYGGIIKIGARHGHRALGTALTTSRVTTSTVSLRLNGTPLPLPFFGTSGASASTIIFDESLAAKHTSG